MCRRRLASCRMCYRCFASWWEAPQHECSRAYWCCGALSTCHWHYIYIYIYIGYTYKSKVTSSCLFIGIACRSFPEVATWLYHKIVKTGILWRMIGIFSVICVGYT